MINWGAIVYYAAWVIAWTAVAWLGVGRGLVRGLVERGLVSEVKTRVRRRLRHPDAISTIPSPPPASTEDRITLPVIPRLDPLPRLELLEDVDVCASCGQSFAPQTVCTPCAKRLTGAR